MRASQLWPTTLLALAVTVSASACSGGSPSPGVAHLGSGSATTTTAAPSTGGAADLAKATAYSACMRSHGVSGFPDPTPAPDGKGYGIQITQQGGPGGGGVDPNSTQFQAADQACKSLMPNHGVAPAMTAAQQQQMLSWAACIRAHGVPDFPDPKFVNGMPRIEMRVSGNGSRAQMDAAQEACKSLNPGGKDAVFGPGGKG